tara:strand:+ start:392 stop:583 length:192 start_codon:yes stop_codon:yes gene_type:complete
MRIDMSATREELINECAELRAENSELREEIARLRESLRREYEDGYRFGKEESRLVEEAVEAMI